jgi:hypothetical protein
MSELHTARQSSLTLLSSCIRLFVSRTAKRLFSQMHKIYNKEKAALIAKKQKMQKKEQIPEVPLSRKPSFLLEQVKL